MNLSMRRSVRFALAMAVAVLQAGAVLAAELSSADDRYLESQYGATGRKAALKMDPQGRAKLHDLINDRSLRDYSAVRDAHVADFMYDVLKCTDEQSCAARVDPKVAPGRVVAFRSCDACHLTGTAAAPSFFKMAKSGAPDAAQLQKALATGHEMSPIHLQPDDLANLADFIRSLR